MSNIDEMRALERTVTPGPWHCGELRGAWGFFSAEHMLVGEVGEQEDMELIVAMRNALPALLNKLDEKDTALKALRAEYTKLNKFEATQSARLLARCGELERKIERLEAKEAQHRQAMEAGRWVELPEWSIPVNKQIGRYRIVGADAGTKTITLEDCRAKLAYSAEPGREDGIIEKAYAKCPTCGESEALPPHACPYQEDINDDSEALCTCCADCMGECAMDI